MASQNSGRGRTAEGLRWIAAAFTIATAALAVRRLIGDRDQVDDTPPVSKAFTVNRSPDDVALLWQEIDPVGDIVEHVRFDLAPGDRGTEVRVQFHPRWFGRRSPSRVQEQLRQFKQLAETGEIARTGIGRGVPRYGDMPEGAVLAELLVRGAR